MSELEAAEHAGEANAAAGGAATVEPAPGATAAEPGEEHAGQAAEAVAAHAGDDAAPSIDTEPARAARAAERGAPGVLAGAEQRSASPTRELTGIDAVFMDSDGEDGGGGDSVGSGLRASPDEGSHSDSGTSDDTDDGAVHERRRHGGSFDSATGALAGLKLEVPAGGSRGPQSAPVGVLVRRHTTEANERRGSVSSSASSSAMTSPLSSSLNSKGHSVSWADSMTVEHDFDDFERRRQELKKLRKRKKRTGWTQKTASIVNFFIPGSPK
ncbi:hypothetical protein HK105_205992 [Polyrhizophydium stewartii]|uniref:Uncharacterized protein n=1 Tax=Polyrhizophydium stewartii TaxID=2732419 RepID=A0ABR4N4I9_9FUNG|nr:hypothetical protein HK105_004411 [Polyrhizophydium stewartii]